MKNFVIPPNDNLSLSHLGTAGFFALGQIYKKNSLYRFHVKQRIKNKDFVILDSGIGDHNPITQDELFNLTLEILPSEVIPLDTLFDIKATLTNLIDFIDRMKNHDLLGKIQILAVPQGNTQQEWLECYQEMLQNPYVNTIGISKLSAVQAWGGGFAEDQGIMESRHKIISYLHENDLLKKSLHFLGMGNPMEFLLYKELEEKFSIYKTQNIFRSTDSCNAVWSAMLGRDWTKGEFERTKTPSNYFDRKVCDFDKIELAMRNAVWFQSILN